MTLPILPILPIRGELLFAEATQVDAAVVAQLRGTAETEGAAALDVFVRSLHQCVRTLGVREVVVDVRELRFMNSSSLKCFVSWFTLVQETPKDAQYSIKFLSNPKLHWQRRSLAALRCFAVNLVSIET
jgi:hypothetical protein